MKTSSPGNTQVVDAVGKGHNDCNSLFFSLCNLVQWLASHVFECPRHVLQLFAASASVLELVQVTRCKDALPTEACKASADFRVQLLLLVAM